MSRPRDPYDWVESWAWPIIERGEVPSFAHAVLLRFAAHANRDGVAWPSGRRLAAMVGLSEVRVRDALTKLRDLGLIDGSPAPGRATRWRLVEDEAEQQHLRDLRARRARATAEAGCAVGGTSTAHPARAVESAPTAHQLRTNCAPTAQAPCDEGEGEGEETLSLSPVAKDDAGERERDQVEFNPRNLVQFKRMGPA